jgi:hypothetical protein
MADGYRAPMSYQPPGPPYPASGYAPQGYGYAPSTQRWMPLKGLSTALLVLLAIVAVLAVAVGITHFNRANVLDDVESVFAFNRHSGEIDDADNAVRAASSAFSLAVLTIAVLWIIWQFRHSKNAQLSRGKTGLGPGWAIGGWFIPFGNYVLPQLELVQSAKASDPNLAPGRPAREGSLPAMLILWWAAFVLGSAVYFGGQAAQPNDDFSITTFIEDYAKSDRAMGAGALILAVAALLAIIVVRTLTERQEHAIASLGSQVPPQRYAYTPQQQWAPPPPPPPPQQQWPPPAPPPPQQWPPPPQ